jgi:hypothetical protein
MSQENKKRQIVLHQDTYQDLRLFGHFGDTANDVVSRLIKNAAMSNRKPTVEGEI